MQSVRTKPWVYAGVLAIAALAVFPYFLNIKYNDFSKNWLNNDYGKNLLSSTEEYSVFMTEGGDNQVFGSLYFTYAVRLRQDLFPYDQKGNIFKRIYGDLRYVTADIVDARMEMVDRGLFDGQEPFYEAIRSPQPPYLVPYALGKPAAYLTWRRPRPNSLGDYYYKPYGIMYKVQPGRYALVDVLSVVKRSTETDLISRSSSALGRTPSLQEVQNWVNQLVQEGLVRRENNAVVYVKDYPKPFVRDPRETFITRWEGIENLASYDYLSREIVIGYAYDSLVYWGEQIKNWEYLSRTGSPEVQAAIGEDIQKAWAEVDRLIELGRRIGYDSPSILHNMGILFLSYERDYKTGPKNLLPKAIELWEQGVEHYPYGWGTYNVLFWGLTQAMERYPQDAERYIEIFDYQLGRMTNAMKHWKSMRKDPTKADPYRQILPYIQARNNFNPAAAAQFEDEIKRFTAMMDSGAINLFQAQDFFQKAVNRLIFTEDEALNDILIRYWPDLWSRYKNDNAFLSWSFQLFSETAPYEGILNSAILNRLLTEGYNLIPRPAQGEALNTLVLYTRFAAQMGDFQRKSQAIDRLYADAAATLSPAEYKNLEAQLDAFVESLP